MSSILINNATIVNEGIRFNADLLIRDEVIAAIGDHDQMEIASGTKIIDAAGMLLIPGVIDDQVHFREPDLHIRVIFIPNREQPLPAGSPPSWICPTQILKR